MDKEEILSKAQRERSDEMELRVRDRSMRFSYIALVLAAAIFTYLREQKGLPIMDLSVTVCASVAVGQFYCFAKTKRRSCLWLGLVALAVGIFALVRFCMGY